jgi:hypothetical protein
MQYIRGVVLVEKKDHKELKKKLAKQKISLSAFFRAQTKKFLSLQSSPQGRKSPNQ